MTRAETQLKELHTVIYGTRKDGTDGLLVIIPNLGTMVNKLVDTVTSLSASLNETNGHLHKKIDVVLDEDGDPISVKRINKRLTDIERKLNRALWGLAAIGLATVLILGRVTERLIEIGHF
jgi:hypothetical protein